MMRRDVHDELRARLREAAEAHQPDRARMLARIERGMTEEVRPAAHRATRPPVFGWLRVAGATAAVAGVLAVGGYAVASAVKSDDTPPQGTVAVTATPTPSPEATSRPPAFPADPSPSAPPTRREEPAAPSSTAPPSGSPSSSAPPRLPGGDVEDGPLWSDGSVDPHSNEFWAQSNVTLKTSGQLTELVVQLRVAQTGGVSSTGAWRSLPEDDFELTVGEEDGFLVYTWRLREGRTVPAGEWVFAGQYDHERGGRDAGDDSYAATARTGSEELAVAGDFAPRGES
ncbi:Integral membrane protein OS=Streptomyces glaucescens OX=1907 GN=SGLAU_08400 PE=4 SV=1 [Streptomyces glaucescens]